VRVEAKFSGFPQQWKQILQNSSGMEKIVRDFYINKDEFFRDAAAPPAAAAEAKRNLSAASLLLIECAYESLVLADICC